MLSIQRKFSCLQTIPGMFAIQRPQHLPIQLQQHPCITKPNFMMMENDHEMAQHAYNKNQVTQVNALHHDERSNYFSMIAINLGRNLPQNNGTATPPLWSPPPSLPNMMSCNLGAFLSVNNPTQVHETNRINNNTGQKFKVEENAFHIGGDGDQKGKAGWS